MEGYCYFNSNPGVSKDDYEDITDDILKIIRSSYEDEVED